MSSQSAREKLDQILRACFFKCVEIILHARIVPFSQALRCGKLNRTFNLELDELDLIRRELSVWDPRSPMPLYIDIYVDLGRSGGAEGGAGARAGSEDARQGAENVVLLERWQILYQPSSEGTERMHQAIFYKRCSVLLRALNARLRLMPAHRLAQRLTRHSGSGGAHARDAGLTEPPARAEPPSAGSASAAGVGGSGVRMLYAMSLENGGRQQPVAHQVACSTQAGSGFPTGSTPREVNFPPIDQSHGLLHVSALYCTEQERSLQLASSAAPHASVAMHAHGTIINDYVDTPRACALLGACAGGAEGGAASPPLPICAAGACGGTAAYGAHGQRTPPTGASPPGGVHAAPVMIGSGMSPPLGWTLTQLSDGVPTPSTTPTGGVCVPPRPPAHAVATAMTPPLAGAHGAGSMPRPIPHAHGAHDALRAQDGYTASAHAAHAAHAARQPAHATRAPGGGSPAGCAESPQSGAAGGGVGGSPGSLAAVLAQAHARSPPQAIPVRVAGARDRMDELASAAFRPVACSTSPPLFGTSPPALLGGASPRTRRALGSCRAGGASGGFCASTSHPGSSPREGTLSSKSSSRCRSPFGDPFPSEPTAGSAAALAGGGGGVGGGGYSLPGGLCGLGCAPSLPSGAPGPVPASLPTMSSFHAHGAGAGPHGWDPDELPPMLSGTLRAGDGLSASLLSRSVVSLSRDLDALRMSVHLAAPDDDAAHAAAHGGGGLACACAPTAISRRTSLESAASAAPPAPGKDSPSPHRLSAGGGGGAPGPASAGGVPESFDEQLAGGGAGGGDEALIFPFAPVCGDHGDDADEQWS